MENSENTVLRGEPFDGRRLSVSPLPGLEIVMADDAGVKHRYAPTDQVEDSLRVFVHVGTVE